jgi:LPPG:FO 2-phospho-L-lactate transferase
MLSAGLQATAAGVADCYRDFLDTLIIDRVDEKLAPEIRHLGIKPIVTNTLMKRITDKIRLAKIAVGETKQ